MDANAATLPGQDGLHPDGQYNGGAKIFHWVTLGLIAIALPTGFVIKFITGEADGAYKMGFYAIHESAGVTILLASLARIAWRATHPVPPHPAEMPRFYILAGGISHYVLYAMLIIQPLLGFFATNAFGFPLQGQTAYLGFIDLPKFMETDEGLANVLQRLHTIGGYLFLAVLATHVGAAVFHHWIRRDGTLLRML